MRLRNYRPRTMREVEYFGVKISIPSLHEWVATDPDGRVHSFLFEPHYKWQVWVIDDPEPFVRYVAGGCMRIGERDAANSLRHYPIGAK